MFMSSQRNHMQKHLGLSHTQMGILFSLKNGGDKTIGEIARGMDMPASNISSVCGRLESMGMIERARDESDRRIVYARLTKKAESSLAEIKAMRHQLENAIFDDVSPEDRDAIIKGLRALGRVVARKLEEQKNT